MKTTARQWLLVALVAALITAERSSAQPPTTATAVKANELWSSPYFVTGKGVSIGVFEAGGKPDILHHNLDNPSAAAIELMNPQAVLSEHATSVAGVIGAAANGNNAVLGVARGSVLYMYSHGSAETNLESFFKNFFTQWANNNMTKWRISNHSYGSNGHAGWDQNKSGQWFWYGVYGSQGEFGEGAEDAQFGWYGPLAQLVDQFTSIATTQILVFSAGNFNDFGPPGPTPYYRKDINGNWQLVPAPTTQPPANGGVDSVDCMEGFKTSKNAITVGSVKWVNNKWARGAFSSAGPTDDGRVKPDVMAYGGNVTVLTKTGTGTSNGTSLAAPAVSGVLAQLAELWQKRGNANPMLSSTARLLLCHTATDLGRLGPDYHFGWGLTNARAAANMIIARQETKGFALQERTMKNNVPDTIYIRAAEPEAGIRVTIAWIDKAATPIVTDFRGIPALNDRTPRLINDLDLRVYPVTGLIDDKVSSPKLPWKLDPTHPLAVATRGDNTVDNIEQVAFIGPSEFTATSKGVYMIVVRNDKDLATSTQTYSIAISGASEFFPAPRALAAKQVGTNGARVTWRKVPNAPAYDVEYRAVGEVAWKSKGSVGATPQADFTNFAARQWQARVRARHDGVIGAWSDPVSFIIGKPATPTGMSVSSITSTSALLKWNKVEGATGYRVAYAPVISGGAELLIDEFIEKTTTDTKLTINNLPPDEYVLWYVQALAAPEGKSDWPEGNIFVTSINCSSYEPGNDDYADARPVRIDEYFRGTICKNDQTDFFLIDPRESIDDEAIRVHFDPYSRPYTVRLWRLDKQQGGFTYSIVPNTSATLSPTEERTITHNGADFYRYVYWIEVKSSNPATIYNDDYSYLFWIETKATSFKAEHSPDDAPGLSRRSDDQPGEGGSLINGASLRSAVNTMAAGR